MLSVEFIYLAACLARQWMKEQEISCMALSVEFIYLAACLARQWIKDRGTIDMRLRANKPNELGCLVLYSVV